MGDCSSHPMYIWLHQKAETLNLQTYVLCTVIFTLFQIPYLSNWFTWNPIANAFTLCFWFRAAVEEYNMGLFSSDCDSDGVSYELPMI